MTTTTGEPGTLPNVHQCIAKAMALITPVGKAGVNREQGYAFKKIDDFMTAANSAMAEAGVHITPRVLQRITDETHTTSNNKTIMRWVDLEVQFELFGPAGDSVKCVLWGEGRDAADKATNKALTAATKYMLMYCLMVPTSDIQDADRDSPEASHSEQGAPAQSGRPAVPSEVRQLQEQILAIGRARNLSKDEIVEDFAFWVEREKLDQALTIGTADVVTLQGFIAHMQAVKPPVQPEEQGELPLNQPAAEPVPDPAPGYAQGDQPPPIPDDIDERIARAQARSDKATK